MHLLNTNTKIRTTQAGQLKEGGSKNLNSVSIFPGSDLNAARLHGLPV